MTRQVKDAFTEEIISYLPASFTFEIKNKMYLSQILSVDGPCITYRTQRIWLIGEEKDPVLAQDDLLSFELRIVGVPLL